jgi:hypothetical protein
VFTFFIAGPGSSNVATAVAKAFASLPGRKPARTTAGKAVSPGEWERIERDVATSEVLAGIEELTLDKLELSCASLRYWYDKVLDDLARARLRKADIQALGRKLDAEIADAKTKITKHSKLTTTLLKPANAALDLALTLLGGAPRDRMYTWKDVVRNLELDRRLVDAYSDRNDKVIQLLAELKGRIEGLHKEKCNPSGTAPPPAPTATFLVSLRPSYTHPGGNTSTLCVRVTTSPAKPGSGVNVTVTGPGVVGPAKQTLTLDPSGQIVANVTINDYGTYSVTATVSAGDETETATATQEVKKTQATCPPP